MRTRGNTFGDLDCDGDYDEDDIRLGMANFGIQEANPCIGDLNGDGEVGPEDLALILGAWGVCP